MLINMMISVNDCHCQSSEEELCSWKTLQRLTVVIPISGQQWESVPPAENDDFVHYEPLTSGPRCCVAMGLITWLPAAAAALPGGQTAKDGRFMEAQTSLILHSHKTLTYLLCRLTGRQAVSECTVPETSSSYFWNTHRLVSQRHKSTLRPPFAWYWDSLLWGRTNSRWGKERS